MTPSVKTSISPRESFRRLVLGTALRDHGWRQKDLAERLDYHNLGTLLRYGHTDGNRRKEPLSEIDLNYLPTLVRLCSLLDLDVREAFKACGTPVVVRPTMEGGK